MGMLSFVTARRSLCCSSGRTTSTLHAVTMPQCGLSITRTLRAPAAADNDVGSAASQPNEFGRVALRFGDQRSYNRGGR
jgi:hypothetical protein